MSDRRDIYTRLAGRDIETSPTRDRALLIETLMAWCHREAHVRIAKLAAVHPPTWRIRVGRWRALVDRPDSNTLRVLGLLDRKDAYR